MNSRKLELKTNILCFVVFGLCLFSQSVFASTIMGGVYDNRNNPLSDIDVELQDDYYRPVERTKTSSVGRFEFSGLRDGRFTVKVMAFRYDFVDQSATVEISTITSIANQVGNGYFTQDFYLVPKKGSLVDRELGVIFAQEIPKEAEKTYDDATKELAKKKTEIGIVKLKEAIKIFPNYYQALYSLGKELFVKGEYGEAAQIFLKASDINPKSPTSLYYLGNSLFKLNYYKSAIIALNQALSIAPSSVQVLYILGKAENAEGKFTDAEKHFLEAKKLSKVAVPEIHWELAQLYGNNLKKYKEAADELELYLKAGQFPVEHSKQIKKLIETFRGKANTTAVKN